MLSIENAVQLVLFSIDSAAISAKIHLAEAGKNRDKFKHTPWLSSGLQRLTHGEG
jgi:hypothetical protein